MKNGKVLLVILSTVCLVFLQGAFNTAMDGDASSLALNGSRPVIDAGSYPSLQEAIDALPAEGGVIKMPPGKFKIREPLRIPKGDVLLKGSGSATHIENLNTEGQPAILLQHPDYLGTRESELWRICLSDFRVTGNENSGHGIEARGINEIYITGVSVSYHGGDGVHLHNCYEDPRICNSLFTYNRKTGLNLYGCHDIVVSANQFEENMDALVCSDGFNLCMTGNNLDDHLGNGVVIENTYGSVVSGNMIEECQGTAIILDRDCYGITLSANVIAHEVSGGIDLRDAHGCAVSANTFTIMGKDALRIGPGSGRITVTGNNFSNSFVGDEKLIRTPQDSAAAGMVLENTSDVAVSGNLFSGLRPEAVTLKGEDNRRILFTGNVLADTESNHAALKDSLVKDNMEARK